MPERQDGVLAVAFHTLGCKVNRVESEDIAADLLGRGARIVPEDEAAVVVINTCTVTGEADAKARKVIRRIQGGDNEPVIVVTGCLAAMDDGALEQLGDRVVLEADKERVADRVAEVLGMRGTTSHDHAVRVGAAFRTRSMLKVEDGCDVFCSYCIVPHARGGPRSVPLQKAVSEAQRLVASGVREIVLTGINIGRYRDGSAGLAELIEAVAQTGVTRLRMSSIEPVDLSPRLLKTLSAVPAVCRHLHVPLQSGSDAVLSAMRRSYTISEYEDRIAAAKDALPNSAVTTDVMAGFPGETSRDAEATAEACVRIGFGKLHVFRYSQRPGTIAAGMVQVLPKERARRAAELRDLGQRLRSEFIESRIGEEAEVLVERVTEEGLAEGTTSDYLRVSFHPSVSTAVGELERVLMTGSRGEMVLAKTLDGDG